MIGWVAIVHHGAIVHVPALVTRSKPGFVNAEALSYRMPDTGRPLLAWRGPMQLPKTLVQSGPTYVQETQFVREAS